jgi:hypothetical protein
MVARLSGTTRPGEGRPAASLALHRLGEGGPLAARGLSIILPRITFSADVTKSHFGPKPQQSEWSLCSSVSGGEPDVEVGKGRDRISRLASQRSLWAWSR